MKKSLIALAVLGTSFAASAQVTLSGRASLQVDSWQATGATAGPTADFRSRTRVVDTGSRIAFAVTESLGGGLNAKVYCETGINIDNASNTGQAGTINANTSEWCSREGHIAVGNQMVELRLGRQNVWWTQGDLNNVGSRWLGADTVTNFFTASGTTDVGVYGVRLENMIKVVAGSQAGAFAGSEAYTGFMGNNGAQGSGVNLTTPTSATGLAANAGVYPLAQTGTNNTVAGEHAGAATSAVGKYSGFKVNYAQGTILGMLDYQTSDRGNNDTRGLSSRDAWKIGGGYRFAGTKSPSLVSVQYFSREGKNVAGTTKREDDGWLLVGQYGMAGGVIAHAQYGKVNAGKTNGATQANTGATGYTLGVSKALSNRTHIQAQYHVIANQAQADYGMAGGSFQSGAPGKGAKTTAFGVGAIHLF